MSTRSASRCRARPAAQAPSRSGESTGTRACTCGVGGVCRLLCATRRLGRTRCRGSRRDFACRVPAHRLCTGGDLRGPGDRRLVDCRCVHRDQLGSLRSRRQVALERRAASSGDRCGVRVRRCDRDRRRRRSLSRGVAGRRRRRRGGNGREPRPLRALPVSTRTEVQAVRGRRSQLGRRTSGRRDHPRRVELGCISPCPATQCARRACMGGGQLAEGTARLPVSRGGNARDPRGSVALQRGRRRVIGLFSDAGDRRRRSGRLERRRGVRHCDTSDPTHRAAARCSRVCTPAILGRDHAGATPSTRAPAIAFGGAVRRRRCDCRDPQCSVHRPSDRSRAERDGRGDRDTGARAAFEVRELSVGRHRNQLRTGQGAPRGGRTRGCLFARAHGAGRGTRRAPRARCGRRKRGALADAVAQGAAAEGDSLSSHGSRPEACAWRSQVRRR